MGLKNQVCLKNELMNWADFLYAYIDAIIFK